MRVLVNGQDIKFYRNRLVAHSVGIAEVEFAFDSRWDGFEKTAVFQLDLNNPIAVELDNNKCTIPSEALKSSGKLKIGIYGKKDDMVMPTRWVARVRVTAGTPIIEVEDE